jgi:hypothetical protein
VPTYQLGGGVELLGQLHHFQGVLLDIHITSVGGGDGRLERGLAVIGWE